MKKSRLQKKWSVAPQSRTTLGVGKEVVVAAIIVQFKAVGKDADL